MLTHRHIWDAVDALAARYNLTPSGLAKRAGLDPTTFNKSKRASADGKKRWPNTESLAKILEATGASLDEFFALVADASGERRGGRGDLGSEGHRGPVLGQRELVTVSGDLQRAISGSAQPISVIAIAPRSTVPPDQVAGPPIWLQPALRAS